MGRRTQQLDTIENIIYVVISLLLVAAALLCLIRGDLHFVYWITGGAALYFLTGAVSAFIRQEKGFAGRGIYRLVLALVLGFLTYIARLCL